MAPPRRLDHGGAIVILFTILGVGLLAGISCLVTWIVFACRYKTQVTDQRTPFTQGDPRCLEDLAPGSVCNCWSDPGLCIHSSLCTSVRAADTFHSAGIASYWCVITIFFAEGFFSVIVFVFSEMFKWELRDLVDNLTGHYLEFGELNVVCMPVSTFFVGIWLAQKRAVLRQKFGDGQPQTCRVSDFLCYWWCQPCSVAMDGKAVDASQGVHV